MTEDEYKELVLADFDQKLTDELLPPELVSPTRKSLKAHSINVCAQRFDPKDKLLLNSFFGAKDDADAYMKAIRKLSAESSFKTLHNFLNDRSINTAFKNINLLAWLIDFRPRPYHPDLKIPVLPVATVFQPQKNLIKPDDTKRPAPSVKAGLLKNKRKVILYAALFMMITLIGYFIVDRPIKGHIEHAECMVWSGDHYQQVDCKQKPGNIPILKLDTQKLAYFKRVNKDTLTPRALGHVWYVKVNGEIEFYSDSGQHPIYTNKRLLRLTSYILNKYVFHVADPR
jgi:hypothetical protein